jgi:acylphosphatase
MAFIKLKAKISGRVQGVGFRWYTQRMAQLLSINGWVKNLPDGSVEVTAVGTSDKIKEFLMTLENGPSMSRVDKIEKSVEHCDYQDSNSFDIIG